jgi:acid phosphatase (class A)
MSRSRVWAFGALGLMLNGTVQAQPTQPPGYIAAQDMPDAALILGPPPANGSGTKTGDVATYQATRALQGTPRWTLAVRDAEFGPAPIMKEFSCAAGMALNPAVDPQLFHLIGRVIQDSQAIQTHAKNIYKRARPFVENGGPMCTPGDQSILSTYSYPSGHSTFSWTVALILTQLMPERATAIMDRARSYGESRVVCGVHYESDVQAGRMTAAVLFSVLQTNPQFRADLEGARGELAQARAGAAAPDSEECRLEEDAITHPVW